MTAIHIFLNGELRDIPSEIDIGSLLDLFSLPKQRVAIELNKSVIRRTDWPTTDVRAGDRVEVVHFVGGG